MNNEIRRLTRAVNQHEEIADLLVQIENNSEHKYVFSSYLTRPYRLYGSNSKNYCHVI